MLKGDCCRRVFWMMKLRMDNDGYKTRGYDNLQKCIDLD